MDGYSSAWAKNKQLIQLNKVDKSQISYLFAEGEKPDPEEYTTL